VLDQRAIVGRRRRRVCCGNGAGRSRARVRPCVQIAQAAGFSPSDIVYVDIAFIDLADVAEVNALYANLFAERQRPARTVYQAARLPFGGKVKVQAIAARA